jgi:hypothetical protein
MGFPQNAYPNAENFSEVSFPQEVTPPSIDPDAGEMICVTYSKAWIAVLMASCDQMLHFATWLGDSDAKKQAVDRAANLKILLRTDIGCDMSGCCYDVVQHRVNSDGDMEINVNGGGWTPDPNDPRTTAPLYPPIVMDDHHAKCDAATNAAEHINDIILETSSQLGGTGSILEIAAAIVAAIFALFIAPETLPALAPVILPLIAGLLFVGQAAWDAYFTDDVHSKILCALYCNIQNDGTFTQAGYDNFITKLTADLPASPAKDYFIAIVSRIGLVGLNNYAAIGTSADANCSACACGCDCIHFTVITGTLVGSGVDDAGNCFIIASSVPHGGGAHETVTVVFNDTGTPDSNCAAYVTAEVLIGTPDIFSQFFLDCGGAGSYHTIVGNPCMSAYDVESDAGFPYTMKLTVNAGSDCGCL